MVNARRCYPHCGPKLMATQGGCINGYPRRDPVACLVLDIYTYGDVPHHWHVKLTEVDSLYTADSLLPIDATPNTVYGSLVLDSYHTAPNAVHEIAQWAYDNGLLLSYDASWDWQLVVTWSWQCLTEKIHWDIGVAQLGHRGGSAPLFPTQITNLDSDELLWGDLSPLELLSANKVKVYNSCENTVGQPDDCDEFATGWPACLKDLEACFMRPLAYELVCHSDPYTVSLMGTGEGLWIPGTLPMFGQYGFDGLLAGGYLSRSPDTGLYTLHPNLSGLEDRTIALVCESGHINIEQDYSRGGTRERCTLRIIDA